MVLEQGDRHDQGDQAATVLGDHLGQLGSLVAAERTLEEAGHVLQQVGVTATGGADGQRGHEADTVRGQDVGAKTRSGGGHEPAEPRLGARAVGEERELVGGVEGDQVARSWPRAGERLPARGREHALDEVLADAGVGRPALLLDRERGERIRQRGSEQPTDLVGPTVVPISTSGHTGTHSTSGPSVSTRNASRLWPPS